MGIPDWGLRELLDYDQDKGVLTWKTRLNQTAWNSRYGGKPALHSVGSIGYRQGKLRDKSVYAHRIIWEWMTGNRPEVVDHINGDRTDNRWVNLRDVSNGENQRNRMHCTGASGLPRAVKLVRGRYHVSIGSRPPIWVGSFTDLDEAVSARDAAYLEHGFHPNHAALRRGIEIAGGVNG